MSDTISLIKPVPDLVFSSLDNDQVRFFATIGFNFCLGVSCSSYFTLLSQYRKSSAPADDK